MAAPMNAGQFVNPSFTGELNTPEQATKAKRTLNTGPVPRAAGALVIGAIIGLSVLKRGFRGA